MMKFVYTLLLLALFLVTPHFAQAAQTYDMSSSANWNIKIIGGSASGSFGFIYKDFSEDVNNNGANDLIVCERRADNNSRSASGSCYIIFDSLLTALTGTGNVIDLSNSSSYNIRFDGAAAGDTLGYSAPAVGDLNNNSKLDLIIPASGADNTRAGSGSVYVIRDDIIDNYSGTGNAVDLANTANFSIRYDGAVSVDSKNYIGEASVMSKDIDGNGYDDIAFGSGHTGIASRARSGSLFIIYDSLHNTYSGTGNIVDLNTSSNYNLVYYNSAMSYFSLLNALDIEDIDNNGRLDIFVAGGYVDNNSREDSGSAYIMYDSLIDNYSGTGNQIDLTTTSNFNVRIDGPLAYTYMPYNSQAVADMNGNGSLDIVLGAGTSYNSRSGSGSIYVIYDSILSALSGTGNTLDMADTSKFSLRIDGPAAGTGIGSMANTKDFNNNGVTDLYFGSASSSNNSRAQSGSTYVMYDSIFSSYTGTGNLIDLNEAGKYSIRYDGAIADDYFGFYTFQDDVNGDGSYDNISTAVWADPSSRADAGEIYIIYNFPHTLSGTGSVSGSTYTLTGSISAASSVTTVSGIQYQLDSNSYSGSWTNCTAGDGTYDSRSEAFTCSISASKGNHTMYVRALDSNGAYTPQSRYATHTFEIQNNSSNESRKEPKIKKNDKGNNEGGSVQPSAGNAIDSGKKITVQLHEDTFPFAGQLFANTVSGNSLATATNIDTVQSPQASDTPLRVTISGRQYWQVGSIQQLWYTTYSTDTSVKPAIIIPELQAKPSVVSLSYSKADLIPAGNVRNAFNPSSLRIAHSLDGKNWNILSSSVVDEAHSSVGAVGKVGGYYMIVSPIAGAQQTLGVSKKRTLGVQNSTKQKIVKTVKQKKQIPTTKQAKPKNEIQQKNKGAVHGITTYLQSIFK